VKEPHYMLERSSVPMARKKVKRPKQFKKLRSKGLSKTASARIANSKRRKK
jgi:hypothetical protein